MTSRHGDPEECLAHCCQQPMQTKQNFFSCNARSPGRSLPPVPVPVTLHIYDMGVSGHVVNQVLRPLCIGLFHCGVEIYNLEWSYMGQPDNDNDSGLFCCRPCHYEGYSYRMAVPMGKSTVSHAEVRKIIAGYSLKWASKKFDTFRHNSCHFSDDFCRKLGVGGIPARLVTLTDAATYLEKSVNNLASC